MSLATVSNTGALVSTKRASNCFPTWKRVTLVATIILWLFHSTMLTVAMGVNGFTVLIMVWTKRHLRLFITLELNTNKLHVSINLVLWHALSIIYVTVPCRNPVVYLIASLPLKHCIAELPLRAGLIVLCRCIRYSCIYEAHVSPALNESSEIWYFRCSNAIEICDGITVDSTWYCHIYFLSTNVTYISNF